MKSIPAIVSILMLATTAFAADPKPASGEKRAASLKANVKEFQLGLSYFGETGKPYYSLLLSVQKVNVKQADSFFLASQISEEQALAIIAQLADTGALAAAVEKAETEKLPQPSYRVTVTAGDLNMTASLGWGKETLKSLDGLRKLLDGDAAKNMDVLLGRLSGHRKIWEEANK